MEKKDFSLQMLSTNIADHVREYSYWDDGAKDVTIQQAPLLAHHCDWRRESLETCHVAFNDFQKTKFQIPWIFLDADQPINAFAVALFHHEILANDALARTNSDHPLPTWKH